MPRADHIPKVTPNELKEILEFLDKLDNPPALMIFGVPGIGKTTIVKKFAEEKGYELRIKHLSRMDPTDWTGIPKNDPNDPYTSFRPISLFRPSKDNKRIVIFFDEINTALPQVLNSALDVILEKRGDVETYGREAILPENTLIISAGNLGPEEDGTYVEEFSSAVKTRLIQVVLEQNIHDWIDWAEKNQIHPFVINFLKNHSEYLVDIDGFKQNLQQIATPRGWERVSNYLKKYFENGGDIKTLKYLIIGTLGKKIGEKFLSSLTKNMISTEELQKQLEKYIHLFASPFAGEIARINDYLKYTKEIFELIRDVIIHNDNEKIKTTIKELLNEMLKNFFKAHPKIPNETLRIAYVNNLNIVRDFIITKLGLKEYEEIFDKLEKAI
jgi:SpoVK/Ycf46/Vps4 family AAA+-type ATPase